MICIYCNEEIITGGKLAPAIFYSHCINHVPKIELIYFHNENGIMSISLKKDRITFFITPSVQTIRISIDGYYVFEMNLKFIHPDNIDYWIEKIHKLAPII